MDQGSVSRRDLLKSGSSLGVIGLAGCAEMRGVETWPSYTGDKEGQDKPEPVDTEEYTLPKEYTAEEWDGTVELSEDYPYLIEKIVPQSQRGEDVVEDSDCLLLECEIEVPETGDEVEVFLVSDDNDEDFREEASPDMCGEITPIKDRISERCPSNFGWYSSDDTEGSVVTIEPGKTKYVRYLIPDTGFWLVIDPTNTISTGLTDIDPRTGYDSTMELNSKIRLLKNSFVEAQDEVLEEFDGWFSVISSASAEETINSSHEFAESVCDSGRADDFSSESVDDVADDVDKAESYFDFIDSMLSDIEGHFLVEIKDGFTDRLKKMMRWSSTALPVVASLMTIAEKSCALANHNPERSEKSEGEKVEDLLMSVAGLVVQAVFMKLGVARQVTGSAIKAAETFVLGHVRQLAGLRMFAYVVNSLAVEFESGIISGIVDFFERIIDDITDRFIDEEEKDSLEQVEEGDDWTDMSFLDEEKWDCSDRGHDVIGSSVTV